MSVPIVKDIEKRLNKEFERMEEEKLRNNIVKALKNYIREFSCDKPCALWVINQMADDVMRVIKRSGMK